MQIFPLFIAWFDGVKMNTSSGIHAADLPLLCCLVTFQGASEVALSFFRISKEQHLIRYKSVSARMTTAAHLRRIWALNPPWIIPSPWRHLHESVQNQHPLSSIVWKICALFPSWYGIHFDFLPFLKILLSWWLCLVQGCPPCTNSTPIYFTSSNSGCYFYIFAALFINGS
jgi:hypothetical protein